LFSVAVNYGGTFIGSSINRSYKGGLIDVFDGCEVDQWNLTALERILEETGIVLSEARVMWCLPGQSVHNLGLADVLNDDDCKNMAGAVAAGQRELSIYVDHARSKDYEFQFPSPQQQANSSTTDDFVRKPREKRELNLDSDFQYDSDGSDFEEEIVDSDYDLYAGDDDLYEDCIEGDEDIKGKKLAEEVELAESENELHMPESDDEQVKFNFKYFTSVDMANP
jgi:hypothetical protein